MYIKFKKLLLQRRRSYEKIMPFLKHHHHLSVLAFILLLFLMLKLILLQLYTSWMPSFRSYIESHYGEMPSYSVEFGMLLTLILIIIAIVIVIQRYIKSIPIKGDRMKAVIYQEYGEPEVFKVVKLKKPRNGRHEMLVKVITTAVTTGDINIRGFTYIPDSMKFMARLMLGFKHPRKELIGNVFSGVVQKVGIGVKGFDVGDEVFGIDSHGTGSYAEFKCISCDKAVVHKPKELSFRETSAIPFGAMTALHFCRKAKIDKEQDVLIIGASGNVGLYALQIAKNMGALSTAVCSTSHIDRVKEFGAHDVIDYTNENFHDNGKLYDVIINTVVNNGKYTDHENSLKENGTYVAISGEFSDIFRSTLNRFNTKKVIAGSAPETKELLQSVLDMTEVGSIKTIMDPKIFKLEELALAHSHAESNQKQGNIVVIVDEQRVI